MEKEFLIDYRYTKESRSSVYAKTAEEAEILFRERIKHRELENVIVTGIIDATKIRKKLDAEHAAAVAKFRAEGHWSQADKDRWELNNGTCF